jgi:hypothetical protein
VKLRHGLIVWGLLCGGCYKNHLYVQQEWIDVDFLASHKVGTPDPKQEHPPQGQRLIVAWDFPKSLFLRNLTVIATIRLWDHTELDFSLPVERKRDTVAFFVPEDWAKGEKILTYRVQIVAADGEIVETWTHHFWTEPVIFVKVHSPAGRELLLWRSLQANF